MPFRLPGLKRKPRHGRTADGSVVVSMTGKPPLVKSLGATRVALGDEGPKDGSHPSSPVESSKRSRADAD